MTIPATAADVTGTWLASVLPDWPADREPEAVRIGAERGIGGWVLRVVDPLDGRSVVVKLPLPGDPRSLEGLRQEVRVFQRLADQLELALPQLLHAATAADRAVLVLEDLGHLRAGDDIAGCSVEDASRALAAVGRLHARWSGSVGLAGLIADGVIPEVGPRVERVASFAAEAAHAQEGRVRALAGEDGVRIVRELAAEPSVLLAVAGEPRTLVHHDFRLDNLFLPVGDGVYAIDWAPISIDRGLIDVAGFIGRCLTTPPAPSDVTRLVDAYCGAFGDGGGSDPRLEQDLALGYRYWLAYSVVVLTLVDMATGPTNVVETWIRRLVPAILAAED